MNDIKSILFKNNDKEFIINVNELTFFYDDMLFPINKKLVFKYLTSLLFIIDEWKDEYINTKEIDGTTWDLVITYQNGTKRTYTGKSSYPYNFDAFLDLNKEIIREVDYV